MSPTRLTRPSGGGSLPLAADYAPHEGHDEDDEKGIGEEKNPLTKSLAITLGRIRMRAAMNEDWSDLLAEAQSLIKQGADTTFSTKEAQLLRALTLIPSKRALSVRTDHHARGQ